MIYLLWYIAIGVIFTAWVLWQSWSRDPTPLEGLAEWGLAIVLSLCMVLMWPLLLFALIGND